MADGVMTDALALEALELPATARNDEKAIRAAYRRLALKWHPDKNRGDGADDGKAEELAAAVFKKVTGAYHFLTTTNFDFERWSRNFKIPPLQSLGDVFEMAMKGQDVENVLRARGEYRPHPEFGINLHVPWSAGTQNDPTWETPTTSYTTTKELGAAPHRPKDTTGSALVTAAAPRSANPDFSKPDKDGFVSMAAGVKASLLPAKPKRMDPSDPGAADKAEQHNENGMGHFKAKEWDMALAEYTEAVMLQPDKVAYRGNRAAAALKLNRNEVAIEDALEATRLDPSYVKGYARAGRGYLNVGKLGEARAQFTKALELDEDDKMSKKGMKDLAAEQGKAAARWFDNL